MLDSVPFTPSQKRVNLDIHRSPDYKLNNSVHSPYTSLKTPRRSSYDSDENETRHKLQKTPQFFSPGKRLFSEESKNKEELSEISSQLKTRLSSALGKLQKLLQHEGEVPTKIDFSDLSFAPSTSPTRKSRPNSGRWSPSNSFHQTNLNLQTLQQSPLPQSSPPLASNAKFNSGGLKHSPLISDEHETAIAAVDDDESSAHNALMAALSRQRRKSRASISGHQRTLLGSFDGSTSLLHPQIPQQTPALQKSIGGTRPPQLPALKLPPINSETKPINEQDAVISLMSLSSPQSVKFSHNRSHSMQTSSADSSRSSSVALTSPNKSNPQANGTTSLPSIRGILNQTSTTSVVDNDATDIEEATTDEDQ